MAEEDGNRKKVKNKGNILPFHGSEKTMNLNNMVYTNIISSPYFKNELFALKTYHEVVDEIYYKVSHLEPWERGSRNLSNQVGMCGGVRGVGTGGIVSTAYCLLYKLFTLRLTRKQVNGLLSHSDSPYIRGLGFMYIRYTQPPTDLWDWYESYLEDSEEFDVRAGGGQIISIGELCETMLSKLEWFSTYFPRIPVPVQKEIRNKLENYHQMKRKNQKRKRSRSYDGQPSAEYRSSDHSGKFENIRNSNNSEGGSSRRCKDRINRSSPYSREDLRDRADDSRKYKYVNKEESSENRRKERSERSYSCERKKRRSKDRSRRSKERYRSSHKKKKHEGRDKLSNRDLRYSKDRDEKRCDSYAMEIRDKKDRRRSLSKERHIRKSKKRIQSSHSEQLHVKEKEAKSSKGKDTKGSISLEADQDSICTKRRCSDGKEYHSSNSD